MIYVTSAVLSIYLFCCFIFILLLIQLIGKAVIGMATKKYAPFVPITDQALTLLKSISTPKENDIIYDLGCGDGKVLIYLADQFPQATYIGIEYGVLPYLLAKIKTRKYKNISVRFKNFFKEDLGSADILIVYLYPRLMDSLLPKLKKELKPGVVLYSLDFAFSKMEPASIEYNKDASAPRGKRMLVYQF